MLLAISSPEQLRKDQKSSLEKPSENEACQGPAAPAFSEFFRQINGSEANFQAGQQLLLEQLPGDSELPCFTPRRQVIAGS